MGTYVLLWTELRVQKEDSVKKQDRIELKVNGKRELDDSLTSSPIYNNTFVSVNKLTGRKIKQAYIYTSEPGCGSYGVAILPFKMVDKDIKYMLQKRIVPCWSMAPQMMSIQGDHNPKSKSHYDDMVNTMKSKTGHQIRNEDVTYLGSCYLYTRSDKLIQLFSVDLSNDTPTGKGTAKVEWVEDIKTNDPLVAMLVQKLAIDLKEEREIETNIIGSISKPKSKPWALVIFSLIIIGLVAMAVVLLMGLLLSGIIDAWSGIV